MKTINYLEAFNDGHTILAQGLAFSFIRVEVLEEPKTRADGKDGTFLVERLDLSSPCEKPTDQSYVCVIGRGAEILNDTEMKEFGFILNKKSGELEIPDDYNAFEHF
jgi:hypothetical protein